MKKPLYNYSRQFLEKLFVNGWRHNKQINNDCSNTVYQLVDAIFHKI